MVNVRAAADLAQGGDAKIIFGVSLALLGFFGNKYRYVMLKHSKTHLIHMSSKSGKVMPGLVMTLYSLASVIIYGRKLL